MKIIDLSHWIHPEMTLYPGTPRPQVTLLADLDRDGYEERLLSLTTHAGTHVDAPAHLLAGGDTLDRYPAEAFIGIAEVYGMRREESCLDDFEAWLEDRHGLDFVLLCSGWDRHWMTPRYLQDFPVVEPRWAQVMARAGLKGVGVETLSVDPAESKGLPAHGILLGAGLLVIENMTGLDALVGERFLLSVLPLKIKGLEGSPVRAVAILQGKGWE